MDNSIPDSQNPPFRYPGRQYYPVIATYVILAVNVVIFILMTLAGGSKSVQVLLDFGASYGPFFRAGEYWRLVMPMFLHIGLAHLTTNMIFLVLLGYFLEPLYGYGRFALLYVLSGMAGSLLSMEASSHIAAGASGAIMGIAGAMLLTGLVHPETVPRRWKRVFGIGILLVIIINLVFGHFMRHIDNRAHVGGLVAGIILAWLVPPPRSRTAAASPAHGIAQPVVILPIILVLAAMAATASHYIKTGQVTSLLRATSQMEATHQTDRAIALAEKARRLAPGDLRVHEALGALYLEKRRYPEAVRELEAALRLNPFSPLDVVRLAAAYEGTGDLPKARGVLEAAHRKMPGDLATEEALAEVCGKLRLYVEAIQHYKNVLNRAPDLAVAQNNLGWLYATVEDPRYRDPGAALKHALIAVKLSQGRQPEFIDTLAAALYSGGKFRLAVETEVRALQLAPHNAEFQANLARYRQAAGM